MDKEDAYSRFLDKEKANKLLFAAVDAGNVDDVKTALYAGANVNAKNSLGDAPLHWAARFGHKNIASLLIVNGADANTKNYYEQTPLNLADVYGHSDISELLKNAAKQQGHADRVTEEREGKGPPQVGG